MKSQAMSRFVSVLNELRRDFNPYIATRGKVPRPLVDALIDATLTFRSDAVTRAFAADNGVHASVGGSRTCARLDMSGCARALGYRRIFTVRDARGLMALASASPADGPVFVDLGIDVGERKPLGRPPEPLVRLGNEFMAFLARGPANTSRQLAGIADDQGGRI